MKEVIKMTNKKEIKTQALTDEKLEVVNDIGVEMNKLKSEIENLKETKPPKDYTVDQVSNWLQSLKNNPDDKAIHILIERIDRKNKTEINIQSTLKSVLCETGCGGWI